jgi:uncharacterized protein (DUF2126 family)/transglutaminase-like putative cysteine protease
MEVQPSEHFCNWQQDPLGNYQARLVFPEKTDHFTVTVNLVVDMVVFNPFDFFLEDDFEEWPFVYDEVGQEELQPFLAKSETGQLFHQLLESVDRKKRRTIDFLVELNQIVQNRLKYTIRMELGVQTPEESLGKRSGSCRDSAWLLVQLLRHLGVASRFVSGYLIQLRPDKESVDGPNGADADFTDLHAWCEAYVPGAGWIGLDPTSGLLAGEGHIPVACAPEPVSAAPVSGAHEKAEVEFSHHMQVTRLADVGRAGRPYADGDWTAIDACGRQIDAALNAHDVRLTVGGEPTFVSSRNPDADEWNIAALGPTKHILGDQLLRRLAGRWVTGQAYQHGQGKWYPGEELPRWAHHCFWRKDGENLWNDQALFVQLDKDAPISPATAADAEALLQAISEELHVDGEHIFPAYEDPFYYAWRERRLPSNVDPLKNNLDDPLERNRLTKIFTQGLNTVVGHVLPLAWTGTGWLTGNWFLRNEHCYLMPGDSAMGFRLPLDSQPWSVKDQREIYGPPDPSGAFASLPSSQHPSLAKPATNQTLRFPDRFWSASYPPITAPELGQSASGIVRSALSIEPREGVLRVFLPPIADASGYIGILGAIERAATRLQQPLLLEGYEPPHHPQLGRMAITPDPGVLEVNVPPVGSWGEQVQQMTSLYEEAHQLHLTADKFDVDGRHTGTGGGCHVVIGGATPADSPWLRRPDVLASFLRYWVNHPSLTYLFAGTFVGPTSQAPRIDEARQDAVAELELALQQVNSEVGAPPWLLDRVLRHILVDVTGNTHRSEICIDKLYSPDGPAGRQGLVELRSFEMPPHWQMACSQHLLVRALLLHFWQQPTQEPLARWGSQLQDRWLLPRYLDLDMQRVCRDLRDGGIPVQAEWFTPHSDFRLPKLGELAVDGIEVELRQAVEPWHVLGEEATSGGQSRYVDSSCERVQVQVNGIDPRRHSMVCNGYRLPLRSTGVAGEHVAGIRYRAWQPPSCLHPTIPVDTPLHIDLYDEVAQRAMAGCTYHVSHPGGRAFDTRPINANEAEGRRCQRFDVLSHVPGTYRPQDAPVIPEAPTTLDLRHRRWWA